MSISYSDGEEVESFILSLVQSASKLDSSQNIGFEHYSRWPVEYHLTAQRSNLVRHLNWSGLKVMEVGAGMGAVSRFLAERCKHLTIVEGTKARFDVLSSRLRDLTNWDGQVGNFESVETGSDYDVVCLIGVLEYAELYVKPTGGDSSFITMLKRARQCLKPGGVVMVAIENRLGLKYFAGCGEDHTGQIFDGICGYRRGPSARTFSRKELRELLAEVGLMEAVEQYPYPDYKIPSCVMGEEMVDQHPAMAAELASAQRYRDYSSPGSTLFPCSLLLESASSQPSLIKELSNSFLFLASASPQSEVVSSLLSTAKEHGELAWYYAPSRKRPVKTVFRISSDGLLAEKEPLSDGETQYSDGSMEITWRDPGTSKEVCGTKLTRSLLRHAYFGDHAALEDELVGFFNWVFDRAKVEGQPESIQGTALDSHVGNVFLWSGPESYVLIDQEWVLTGPMRKSWFVMRNLCTFDQDLVTALAGRWKSMRELYELICSRLSIKPSFAEDIETEARFACLLGESEDLRSIRAGLELRFSEAAAELGFPRNRLELETGSTNSHRDVKEVIKERDRLRAEVAHLNAHRLRKIYWLPRKIDELMTKARHPKG